MKTSTKIIISIAALLVVLIAIFFAAPYADYRKAKENDRLCYSNPFDPTTYKDTNIRLGANPNYFQCCALWWKTKFKGKTIDGGTLPEITVTATKY